MVACFMFRIGVCSKHAAKIKSLVALIQYGVQHDSPMQQGKEEKHIVLDYISKGEG
jgi:hypothetical protein